jgi:hypothetical protein
VLGADDPPVVVVEGRVEDEQVSSVSLIANSRRIDAEVRNGSFRAVIPLVEPELRLEAVADGTPPRHSQAITVRAMATARTAGLLVMDWQPGSAGMQADLAVTWRPRPGRSDGAAPTSPLPALPVTDWKGATMFYVRDLKPGVYTFILHYSGSLPIAVSPTLYLAEAGAFRPRSLRPLTLNRAGDAVIARLLLPQGVLWDQDEWFTGQSEDAEAVTKFRFPDGITWRERKADLR